MMVWRSFIKWYKAKNLKKFKLSLKALEHETTIHNYHDAMAAGVFDGHWYRDGSKVVMRNVVWLHDGTQNLNVITFNTVKNTLYVEGYIF